jgi:flagellar basal-body rod protein FlgB
MPLIDSAMLRVLSGSLDVNAFRQTLLSSNIANVDTPGYRTRDIDFRRELVNAVAGAGGGEGPAVPVAHQLQGLIERPDGNNVSADREGLLLATTQLRFTLSAQLIRDEFHKILTAIREGA